MAQQRLCLFEFQGLHLASLPNGHHLVATNLLVGANGCDRLRTWRALLGHATGRDAAGSWHATLRGRGTGCGSLLGGVLNPGLLFLHAGRRRGSRGLTGLLGRRAGRNGALHQERRHLGVDLLDHFLEQLVRLKLVDEKRVLLLEPRVLHVAPQVVHVAKVLFPVLVNDGQHHGLLQGVEHALALGQDTLLDVRADLKGLASVGERDQNVLEVVLLVVVHALNHRVGALGEVNQLGLVQLLCTQVGLVRQLLRLP